MGFEFKKLELLFCAICLIGMLSLSSNLWADRKLLVMTSIFPLQEFAKAVGGERVKVDQLVPPGAEPHTWEPRPMDIVNTAQADIFIYIGAGMEPWIKDILEGVKHDSLVIIEASDGLKLIENQGITHTGQSHRHSMSHDPHIWLDFQNDQKIIDKIVTSFSQKDPDGRSIYIQNAQIYKKRLAELDQRYAISLKNCKKSVILLGGHSSFAYLARRYGLQQIPLYGISPDAEPRPGDLALVIDIAKQTEIKAVFFERLINDTLARVIAQDIGAKTLVLNPGPNLTKEETEKGLTFIAIMEENLKNLMKGLGCD